MNATHKDCIMVLTNKLTKHTLHFYNTLKNATTDCCNVFLLYHTTSNAVLPAIEDVKIEPFTNNISHTLGYRPFTKILLPGSTHFPVSYFFRKHPGYQHYWYIEDDVAFNGNWKDSFTKAAAGPDYDFVACHIRKPADTPKWFWCKGFQFPEQAFNKGKMLSSFGPIYRASNQASTYIDAQLRGSYCGHQEVLFPSLLNNGGFTIADLGIIKIILFPPYHPVKETITFAHALDYVKRTTLNRKNYLVK